MKSKRYSELPGVTISEDDLPPSLRHLLGDFKSWSFMSEMEIEKQLAKLSDSELKALMDRWSPHVDEIERFALAHKDDVPVPDAAAMVQVFTNTMRNVEAEHRLRSSPWRKR